MTKVKTTKKPVEKTEVKPITKSKEEQTEQAVKVIEKVVVHEPQKVVTHMNELKLDRQKIELLKRTIARGATDDELLMFVNVCRGLGLSPFLRHVHLVKRWDSKLGVEVAAVQVGIDGFRSIAEGTGAYAGNTDPVFNGELTEDKNTVPEQATVTIQKIVQGIPYPFTATARWREFYPGVKQGFMWRAKPHLMLGKCAEAQALRKAFPKVLGGVYVPEELDNAGTFKAPSDEVKEKYDKAKDMIARTKDADGLKDYLKKLDKSKLYTPAQKKELKGLGEAQIKLIEGKEK